MHRWTLTRKLNTKEHQKVQECINVVRKQYKIEAYSVQFEITSNRWSRF